MKFPINPADLGEYQRIAEDAGFSLCVGVDEAGRGPLAGPVTAAAVHLPSGIELPGLNDSKQVKESERERLYDILIGSDEILCSVVNVSSERIDEINVLQATHEAMRAAVAGLPKVPDLVLVDGNPVTGFLCPAINVIKGDAKSAAIAAASILAKVSRDRIMLAYADEYPEYGFEKHKGYGTKMHLQALREYGACPIHRQTFAPIKALAVDAKQGRLF